MAPRPRPFTRFSEFLGPDAASVFQSLIALGLNSVSALAAGVVLGSITTTFEELPGLLVMVPPAVGLRGNVFGALGNRLSTAIHTGQFQLSARRDTVTGQNIVAAMLLSVAASAVLAVVAKAVAVAFGVANSIPVLDFVVISVLGGVLASVAVLAGTLALAATSVRRGWDLDNVTAPVVTSLGDLMTIPALYLAAQLVGLRYVTVVLGVVLVIAALASAIYGLAAALGEVRRIVRESVPVLAVAATLSALAGIAIERQFEAFFSLPALLILVPAFLGTSGAMGGILSGRLATKLHLGIVEPKPYPDRIARRDITLVFVIALPVLTLNAVGAELAARVFNQASPGIGDMLATSVLAGLLTLFLVVAFAYYGTIVTLRMGLDPDTHGIPIVTSGVDLVGAFAFVLALVTLGIT